MLRLPPFRLRTPSSLEEAARIVAGEGPAARFVAGGTDLWPNMKRRHQKADTVVSLMAVPGLAELRGDTGGNLEIGGTVTLDRVERDERVQTRFPALARAVASISSPPLRNMGTIGGNLCVDTRCTYYNQTEEWRRSIDYCLKEEGTVCWVAPGSSRCWAHTASDSAPMLAALGARVRLAGAEGEREIPLADLYRDDGIDYLGKRPEEVLSRVVVPAEADAGHCRSAFWKLRRRGSIDFAVLSVAVALWQEHGVVTRARIHLGAVASWPVGAEKAAEALVGRPVGDEEAIREAAKLVRRVATPMDNTDFLAQWRGVMAERYAESALREASGLEVTGLAPNHRLVG